MKRLALIVALCVLVFLVACAKKEMQQEIAVPSVEKTQAPTPTAEAEADNLEASVAEVDQLEQDLSTEYLDSVDQDLSSVDEVDWE